MVGAKAPRSLRVEASVRTFNDELDGHYGRKVSAVAGMIAVASIGGAEAQQAPLPPVTVTLSLYGNLRVPPEIVGLRIVRGSGEMTMEKLPVAVKFALSVT
mgnify:CR=1 FL=1